MRNNKKCILVLFLVSLLLIITSCTKTEKYELKFETNGGNIIETQTIEEGTDYTLPVPTKEGYAFKGWYLNEGLTGDATSSIKVDNNITLYASWAELATIKLELDGGSMSEATTIQAEVGSVVYDLVKDLKPTKTGLVFGAWFNGDAELGTNAKLTSKGLTLKAKYKVKYTTTICKQNLTKDGYDEEVVDAYEYVGKTITLDNTYEGFSEVAKADTVYEITLTDKDNNLKLYFDRNQYTITLRSNYPNEELAEETKTITVLYGEEVELPSVDFACDGYYLLGYATTVDGELTYDAHFIENACYNQEKTEYETVKLATSRNISLYAKWNKGYKDMFGGSDYVFLTGDKETIYLARGGVYFVGEYFESDNGFIFYNDYENIEGKIFENETFAYYNDERDEYSATLYEVGTGLNENEKILFDAYNGITYSIVNDGKTDLSKGTYTIDENGYYIAVFTEGTLSGQTLKIVIGSVTLNSVKTDAYQVCEQSHVDLGQLVRFAVNEGNLTYYTSAYQIVLSGFGTLAMNSGSSTTTYYYVYDEENQTLTLTSSSGSTAGILKIMEVNGIKGYMVYSEALDHEYEGADGAKLVLDGVVNATYTSGDTTVTGYYTTASSAFGGKIITFKADGKTYTFLTSTTSETVTKQNKKGEDEEETIYYYNFETKLEGYAEYYYKDAAGTYYAPLVVVNDSKDGYVKIYGYTESKTFELVLEGTFVKDETTSLYTFETVNKYTPEVAVYDTPIDLSQVVKFVCSLDTTTTSYAINYWYSSTIGDVTTNYEVLYTSADGGKLTLVSGIAILAKDGYVVTGTYATKNGLTTITTSSGKAYVEIDEEAKTFITYDYAPYNAYIITEDGQASSKLYLAFDGKGNADYVYYVTEEVTTEEGTTEEEVEKKITGTITKLDELTKQGYQIYEFKADEKTFKYLAVSSSSTYYILPAYGKYQGTYTSQDGILYLDGFSYYGSYTDADANEYVGMYTASDDVARITTEDGYLYFDLKENQKFTARGKDYGTYILMDNQGAPGEYLEFDGYGKLTVYKMNYNETTEEYDKEIIDDNGTYSNVDGYYSLLYKENTAEKTIKGYLSTYTYSSNTYRIFAIEHAEVVQTFVNTKDWSILKLDSIGNATKIDNKGNIEEGTFMLITDSLLYYVNDASDDANIYKYDKAKGTITPSEFTARGYYTSDLKSLLFSKYGFAIFNNETRYYYAMNGNDVIIYHQDASNKEANEYGFIEENFGEFENIKEYKGETYYANDGYAITFTRAEATKDKYPVLVDSSTETYACLEELTFTPSGSSEFTVSGTVKVNNTTTSCYVTRALLDDGTYEMYITVGYYRFDITAVFTGKDEQGESSSTYEVTGLKYVRYFYPYAYLSNYYMIYSFLGSTYASNYQNNLGMVYINKLYDEDGKVLKDSMTIEFYDGQTNVYDLNNNKLEATEAEYTINNNIYTVEVQGTDGYTYLYHLYFSYHKSFQLYGYRLYGLTRKEVITDGDYEFTIERLIATDTSYPAGTPYQSTLKYKGETLEYAQSYIDGDTIYYIVRTYDETTNQAITTTYYAIKLTEKDSQVVGETPTEGEETEEDSTVKPYESMKVSILTAKTYYANQSEDFVDVVDGKITLVKLSGTLYLASSCEYDEVKGEYTITLTSGTKYIVRITENVMSYEEVIETSTEDK